tara:strand:+ start:15418 stop:16308 length:891 start_codon:yes stop_codon:yes gene_type:complete
MKNLIYFRETENNNFYFKDINNIHFSINSYKRFNLDFIYSYLNTINSLGIDLLTYQKILKSKKLLNKIIKNRIIVYLFFTTSDLYDLSISKELTPNFIIFKYTFIINSAEINKYFMNLDSSNLLFYTLTKKNLNVFLNDLENNQKNIIFNKKDKLENTLEFPRKAKKYSDFFYLLNKLIQVIKNKKNKRSSSNHKILLKIFIRKLLKKYTILMKFLYRFEFKTDTLNEYYIKWKLKAYTQSITLNSSKTFISYKLVIGFSLKLFYWIIVFCLVISSDYISINYKKLKYSFIKERKL